MKKELLSAEPSLEDITRASCYSIRRKLPLVPSFLGAVYVLCLVFPGTSKGQGTIRFGFEEYEPGVTPSFVRGIYQFQSIPMVADRSATYFPFEGQRMLTASGAIAMASPDGNLIKSFSLRFYSGPPLPAAFHYFGVGGIVGDLSTLGQWTEYSRTFEDPVREITISSFFNLGETFPFGYSIDAVEFVTVPEPGVAGLLALGLAGFVGARFARRHATKLRQ